MSIEKTTSELDAFFRSFLDIEGFAGIDDSLNGLQVDNDGSPVKKIAFAVDANMDTFEHAAACGAGMLFVHHGLFWGKPTRLVGNTRARIKFLLDKNIALYGVHLPLDQCPKYGNNAVLSQLLGLENIEPFGDYHGRKIGYKGTFARPVTVEEAVKKISFMDRKPVGVFPFGKKENATCGVISGGAAHDARQAIAAGLDLYVTGEAGHSVYHECLENKLNMIAGGHHSTEVHGPAAVMRHCSEELGIDTEFIDIPTGL
jgi:dinuclear metal center YbgI/SA1388 family protein